MDTPPPEEKNETGEHNFFTCFEHDTDVMKAVITSTVSEDKAENAKERFESTVGGMRAVFDIVATPKTLCPNSYRPVLLEDGSFIITVIWDTARASIIFEVRESGQWNADLFLAEPSFLKAADDENETNEDGGDSITSVAVEGLNDLRMTLRMFTAMEGVQ